MDKEYLVIGYQAEGYHSGKEKQEIIILDKDNEMFNVLYDILESKEKYYGGLDGKHSEVKANFIESDYIKSFIGSDILHLEDLKYDIKIYCKKYNYSDEELEKLISYTEESFKNTRCIIKEAFVKKIIIIKDLYGNELYNNS